MSGLAQYASAERKPLEEGSKSSLQLKIKRTHSNPNMTLVENLVEVTNGGGSAYRSIEQKNELGKLETQVRQKREGLRKRRLHHSTDDRTET